MSCNLSDSLEITWKLSWLTELAPFGWNGNILRFSFVGRAWNRRDPSQNITGEIQLSLILSWAEFDLERRKWWRHLYCCGFFWITSVSTKPIHFVYTVREHYYFPKMGLCGFCCYRKEGRGKQWLRVYTTTTDVVEGVGCYRRDGEPGEIEG